MTIGFLEIFIGDESEYQQQSENYRKSIQFFEQVAPRFALEDKKLENLNQEEIELLLSSPPPFEFQSKPPRSLQRGKLHLSISDSSGLSKTRENFINLLTGSKGFSKSDKSKKLHYEDSSFFRIEKDFVIQTGDVTRNDGSGGEASISGLKAESHGLGINPKFSSICMANSGRKDSISSQFFIVITSNENQLKKLSGRKYVNFGNVICQENQEIDFSSQLDKNQEEDGEMVENWRKEGSEILKELIELGSENGNPLGKAWIGDCGILQN